MSVPPVRNFVFAFFVWRMWAWACGIARKTPQLVGLNAAMLPQDL